MSTQLCLIVTLLFLGLAVYGISCNWKLFTAIGGGLCAAIDYITRNHYSAPVAGYIGFLLLSVVAFGGLPILLVIAVMLISARFWGERVRRQ